MANVTGFVVNGVTEKYDYNSLANRPNLNEKYEKPASGIPKTDLAQSVQDSLRKADTALQEHQDISGKADKTEVNTLISAEATARANAIADEATAREQAISAERSYADSTFAKDIGFSVVNGMVCVTFDA